MDVWCSDVLVKVRPRGCTLPGVISRCYITEIERVIISLMLFFFFSSRRRHTRLQGDWSSDVCSSDLGVWCRKLSDSGAPKKFACCALLASSKDSAPTALPEATWLSTRYRPMKNGV